MKDILNPVQFWDDLRYITRLGLGQKKTKGLFIAQGIFCLLMELFALAVAVYSVYFLLIHQEIRYCAPCIAGLLFPVCCLLMFREALRAMTPLEFEAQDGLSQRSKVGFAIALLSLLVFGMLSYFLYA